MRTMSHSRLVEGTSTILARVASLLPAFQSVMGDPAGGIYRLSEALRHEGMRAAATILLAETDPRPGLAHRQARDILVALLGPEIYRTLVLELGWPVTSGSPGLRQRWSGNFTQGSEPPTATMSPAQSRAAGTVCAGDRPSRNDLRPSLAHRAE